ncbi:beta-lactamase family protein [Mycobacterium sp. Y57]|nr:beta-lactamase family protein [Mycolicibacterium xanthum]
MAGFPPPPESVATLENWQQPPFNRWAFQHLRELIPTQRIAPGPEKSALAYHANPPDLDGIAVTRIGEGPPTVGAVLADSWTDAVIIVHDGQVVLERYLGEMRADTPHLLMSVSKSIVSCVCGNLVAQGLLDPDAPVTRYVAEFADSGYDGATVRNLLDMRTGVAFSEEYENPQAGVRVIERHMGWRRRTDENGNVGMYAYLASLPSDGPHGGPFVYRSADTDALGWVCERAAGVRMADLVSSLIWAPMGAEFDAEVTCDPLGSAVHDGGINATARDMARFGMMLIDDGRVGERAVVPEGWLQQARHIDADIRGAFSGSDSEPVLPGGWYRNQFWFVPGPSGDIQLCLGINGQMVFVDHETRTVAVKLSSWPTAQDAAYLIDTIRAFGAVGRHLAGLGPVGGVASPHPSGPAGVVEGSERGHGRPGAI